MGKRGPAPKPTSLRLLEGNPSGKPFNQFEPKPDPLTAIYPDWFTAQHIQIWERIIPMLTRIGIATEADYEPLIRYIDTLVDWDNARKWVAEKGVAYPIYEEVTTYKKNAEGKREAHTEKRLKYMQQWPQVSIKRNCAELLLRMEQQFGMTPSARTGLLITPPVHNGLYSAPKDDKDPFAI